jgi:hypothetical protein
LQDAKTYVENYLQRELEEFVRRGVGLDETELTLYDKVLIYKYSLDGYEPLNETLRSGRSHPMANLLNEALEKLPDYRGVVYRGTVLTNLLKEEYKRNLAQNIQLEEAGFLSTSLSRNIANQFNRNDTLFSIYSFHGKQIELFSFHGISNPFNEKEVLFKSNSQFSILDIEETSGTTLITLEEIYHG